MSKPPWPTNDDPAPVVDTDGRAVVLDLGPGSRLGGKEVNSLSVDALSTLIEGAKANAGTRIAFGRYGEPREVYQGNLFASRETDERRTIHMGIDVFCAAGTPVLIQPPFSPSTAIWLWTHSIELKQVSR